MEDNKDEVQRFLLIGPAKTMIELTTMLNSLEEGITRLVTVQKERSGYFALLDRAIQAIITPEDYLIGLDLEQPDKFSEFGPTYKVNMA